MLFKNLLQFHCMIPILFIQITTAMENEMEDSMFFDSEELSSSYFGDRPSNRVLPLSIEEDYGIIEQDDETQYICTQLFRSRLLQFLKNVEAYNNNTRKGRQDDGDGGDGGDGDGGDGGDGGGDGGDTAAAAAPAEVPQALPNIIRVVANAFASNATQVENTYKALAPLFQSQVTGAVALFANLLQGASPLTPIGAPPSRPAAPIRAWPTRKPVRNRPTQSGFNTSPEPMYPPDGPSAGDPPRTRHPTTPRIIRRRPTTTKEPYNYSEEDEELEPAVSPPSQPPPQVSVAPIFSGSLKNFYSSTLKMESESETKSPVEQATNPKKPEKSEIDSVFPMTLPPPGLPAPVSGPEGFSNALLNSISQSLKQRPGAWNPVSAKEPGFSSIFRTATPVTSLPVTPSAKDETTTIKPKRRRRSTTTTESEYYDEDTEAVLASTAQSLAPIIPTQGAAKLSLAEALAGLGDSNVHE